MTMSRLGRNALSLDSFLAGNFWTNTTERYMPYRHIDSLKGMDEMLAVQ
jgi:hypothetical protein